MSLTLEMSFKPPGLEPFSNVLEALKMMPHLRTLSICNALIGEIFYFLADPKASAIIDLSELEVLHVEDEADDCMRLLQHHDLSFPCTTKVMIVSSVNTTNHPELCEMVAAKLFGPTGSTSTSPILSASLSVCSGSPDGSRFATLRCWITARDVALDEVNCMHSLQPALVLSLNIGRPPARHIPTLEERNPVQCEALLQSFPLSSLQTLYLDSRVCMEASVGWWRRCCYRMTDLRQLYIAKWGGKSLPDVLAPNPLDSVMLAPKLEVLYFKHMKPGQGMNLSHVHALRDALKSRKASGLPLRRLVFEGCHGLGLCSVTQLFTDCAETVDWDGERLVAEDSTSHGESAVIFIEHHHLIID